MAEYKYLINKEENKESKPNRLNVVNLLKKTKIEQRKEKRKNILVAAAAISALAVSGLIISL